MGYQFGPKNGGQPPGTRKIHVSFWKITCVRDGPEIPNDGTARAFLAHGRNAEIGTQEGAGDRHVEVIEAPLCRILPCVIIACVIVTLMARWALKYRAALFRVYRGFAYDPNDDFWCWNVSDGTAGAGDKPGGFMNPSQND